MNTKQKILNEALTLFSEKGYSSVYVGDIADAVGIKASSLYKHYKSKQEIFDSCIKVFPKEWKTLGTVCDCPTPLMRILTIKLQIWKLLLK